MDYFLGFGESDTGRWILWTSLLFDSERRERAEAVVGASQRRLEGGLWRVSASLGVFARVVCFAGLRERQDGTEGSLRACVNGMIASFFLLDLSVPTAVSSRSTSNKRQRGSLSLSRDCPQSLGLRRAGIDF